MQLDQDSDKYFVQGNNKKCEQRLINKEVHHSVNYRVKYIK